MCRPPSKLGDSSIRESSNRRQTRAPNSPREEQDFALAEVRSESFVTAVPRSRAFYRSVNLPAIFIPPDSGTLSCHPQHVLFVSIPSTPQIAYPSSSVNKITLYAEVQECTLLPSPVVNWQLLLSTNIQFDKFDLGGAEDALDGGGLRRRLPRYIPFSELSFERSGTQFGGEQEDEEQEASIGSGLLSDVFRAKLGSVDVAVKRLRWTRRRKKTVVGGEEEVERLGESETETDAEAEEEDGEDDEIVLGRIRSVLMKNFAISHENVLRIFGVTEFPNREIGLIVEYGDGGDLKRYWNAGTSRLLDRMDIAIHICEGVQELHRNDVVLGDLKSTNIVLFRKTQEESSEISVTAKVGNFGVSKALPAAMGLGDTPSHYADPEIIVEPGREATHASDIYSLSVILFELFVGHSAFPQGETRLVLSEQDEGKIADELWRLIQNGLQPSHESRPPVEEFLRLLKLRRSVLSLQSLVRTEDDPILFDVSDCRYDLVKRAGASLGWTLVDENPDERGWTVKWMDKNAASRRIVKLFDFQRINHLSGIPILSRRHKVSKLLEIFREMFPEDYDFYPRTFALPEEISELREFCRSPDHESFLWAVKPSLSSMTHNVEVVRRVDEPQSNSSRSHIAQLVMTNPLLMEGRKFEIRVFLVIGSVKPLRLYMFREGFVRLAGHVFDRDERSVFVHCTNYGEGHRTELGWDPGPDGRTGHQRDFAFLEDWLWEHHSVRLETIFKDMEAILVKFGIAGQPCLEEKYRFAAHSRGKTGGSFTCFEILGIDFMLDENFKLWLTDAIHSPSYGIYSPVEEQVMFSLVQQSLEVLGVDPLRRNTTLSFIDEGIEDVCSMTREEELSARIKAERGLRTLQLIYPRNGLEKLEQFFVPWDRLLRLFPENMGFPPYKPAVIEL